MNHYEAGKLLADFGHGRLSGPPRVELEQHLEGCSSCRSWLETYFSLGRALAVERELEHPDADELAAWAVADPDPTPEAVEHLSECADCSREVELLGRAVREARGGRQRPEEESRRSAARRRAIAVASIAASLVFVVLSGALLLRPQAELEREFTISGGTLVGQETIVGRTIYASKVEIASGSTIVLDAEETVTFGEGFAVASGATLEVGKVRELDL